MNETILIIDDDTKLNRLLADFLKDFGFEVISSTRPEEGLKRVRQEAPDLVILDVMLPGMSGFEVCKAIRGVCGVPIIMLTARGEVTDKVVGLELGADDYMPKPFEPRELVARIQSVLRRARGVERVKVRRYGGLEVDFSRRVARVGGEELELTTNEYAALALLVRNRGKVMSRDEILDELRGMECEAFNRSVDITMSRLRHKLGDDPKAPAYIKTVWGAGYVFIGEEAE
jgi:DNA-binding response OmpR family regulator